MRTRKDPNIEQNTENQVETRTIPAEFAPYKERIKAMFDFALLMRRINSIVAFRNLKINQENSTCEVETDFDEMQKSVKREIGELAEGFNAYLQLAFYEKPDIEKNEKLQSRLEKLTQYFIKKIDKLIFAKLPTEADLEYVNSTFKKKIAQIESDARAKYEVLTNYSLQEIINPTPKTKREKRVARLKEKEERLKNGEIDLTKHTSALETLELWRQGKNIEEISAIRGIAVGSIERHLGGFIVRGELSAREFIEPEKLYKMVEFFTNSPTHNFAYAMAVLGGEFNYREMRFAQAHLAHLEGIKKNELKEIRKKEEAEQAIKRQADKEARQKAHQEQLLLAAQRRAAKEVAKAERLKQEAIRQKEYEARQWRNALADNRIFPTIVMPTFDDEKPIKKPKNDKPRKKRKFFKRKTEI